MRRAYDIWRRSVCGLLAGLVLSVGMAGSYTSQANPGAEPVPPKVTSISAAGVVNVRLGDLAGSLKVGERLGPWTLMAIIGADGRHPLAFFEDFTEPKGGMV